MTGKECGITLSHWSISRCVFFIGLELSARVVRQQQTTKLGENETGAKKIFTCQAKIETGMEERPVGAGGDRAGGFLVNFLVNLYLLAEGKGEVCFALLC